jgi:copper(I)-binding protein
VVSALIAVAMVLVSGPAPIAVTNVRAFPVAGSSSAMVVLDIRNEGPADRLVEARAPATKLTVLKAPVTSGLPIPARSEVSLAMEAGHIMLMGVEAPLNAGAALPIELDFAKGGTQNVKAVVSDMAMDHGAAEDVDRETAPSLEIDVSPDADGWVVRLRTSGFTFAPEMVDGPHVPGTGHAHLYVSGTKIGRLFGETGRIGALPEGTHQVEVTLNTNDHRSYAVGGTPIVATATIKTE